MLHLTIPADKHFLRMVVFVIERWGFILFLVLLRSYLYIYIIYGQRGGWCICHQLVIWVVSCKGLLFAIVKVELSTILVSHAQSFILLLSTWLLVQSQEKVVYFILHGLGLPVDWLGGSTSVNCEALVLHFLVYYTRVFYLVIRFFAILIEIGELRKVGSFVHWGVLTAFRGRRQMAKNICAFLHIPEIDIGLLERVLIWHDYFEWEFQPNAVLARVRHENLKVFAFFCLILRATWLIMATFRKRMTQTSFFCVPQVNLRVKSTLLRLLVTIMSYGLKIPFRIICLAELEWMIAIVRFWIW